MEKRAVDVVVISDVHLGTVGCHAEELLNYLKSIQPKMIILNGDIVDIWAFTKRYFPKAHMQVIQYLIKFAAKGVPVYYITGNHDDLLRKFSPSTLGNFHLKDKLVIELDGKKAWFFHGDVFDRSITHARWIAKLGGFGYDMLILLNRLVNRCSKMMGGQPYSFSKKIKNSVKGAVKFISDFEQTATTLAIENGYDYVACGHIHQPQKRIVKVGNQKTMYLNSGDWIENLTALEYKAGKWKIYQYDASHIIADEVNLPTQNAKTIQFNTIEPEKSVI